MDRLQPTLDIWHNEYWTQKRHLLAIAMHREGVDYIHSGTNNGGSVNYVRPGVELMVRTWDFSRVRPASEFTVEWVKQNESMYSADRRLIDGLFEQIPNVQSANHDIRWQQGQTTAFSSRPNSGFIGIRDVSSKTFATIFEIQEHT